MKKYILNWFAPILLMTLWACSTSKSTTASSGSYGSDSPTAQTNNYEANESNTNTSEKPKQIGVQRRGVDASTLREGHQLLQSSPGKTR